MQPNDKPRASTPRPTSSITQKEVSEIEYISFKIMSEVEVAYSTIAALEKA